MRTTLRTSRAAFCVVVATLVLAAPAQAIDGRAVADRYWGPHPCAGQVQVVYDATLGDRGNDGEAIGLAGPWNGYQGSCAISVRPGLRPERECFVIVHEVGHLIYGEGHDGPMHPANLEPTECVPPVTLTVAAPKASHRRSRPRRSCKSSPQRRFSTRYLASAEKGCARA